jgi:hypothetical protein
VPVKGSDQGKGRDRVLDQREAAAGLLGPGHEPHADERHRFPVLERATTLGGQAK